MINFSQTTSLLILLFVVINAHAHEMKQQFYQVANVSSEKEKENCDKEDVDNVSRKDVWSITECVLICQQSLGDERHDIVPVYHDTKRQCKCVEKTSAMLNEPQTNSLNDTAAVLQKKVSIF